MQYIVQDIRTFSAQALCSAFDALSPAQQAAIVSLRRTGDRVRRLCAWQLALSMLSTSTGLPPQAITIQPDSLGKPQLPGLPLHFNLSHSGFFVACVVDAHPVGIDLEVHRPVRPALAARVCAPAELAYIRCGEAGDAVRFLQVWTAKEALLKHQGIGIRRDLRTVCVVQNGQPAIPALKLLSLPKADYVLSIVSAGT